MFKGNLKKDMVREKLDERIHSLRQRLHNVTQTGVQQAIESTELVLKTVQEIRVDLIGEELSIPHDGSIDLETSEQLNTAPENKGKTSKAS